jgi:hypothetical protein
MTVSTDKMSLVAAGVYGQGLYIGLEDQMRDGKVAKCSEGVSFQPTSITPNVTIATGPSDPATGDFVRFSKYMSPSNWMVMWGWDRLPEGTYEVKFDVPAAYCEATACVPNGTVTCTPDCPTACGTAASTISSCKDSCGAATTKQCPEVKCAAGPMCTAVKVAVQDKGSGTWTLLASNDLVATSVKVGDKIKLYADITATTQKVQFRATAGAAAVSWLTGTVEGTQYVSPEITISQAGVYTFEAQVQ